MQSIGLIEKVYEVNALKLVKVGFKLLDFQRAARYFFEILTGCNSWGCWFLRKINWYIWLSVFNRVDPKTHEPAKKKIYLKN